MLFYRKVVVLDKDIHRNVRFKRESFGFARDVNMVILTCSEFAESSKEYPIVFVKAQNGEIVPAVLLGVREGENLYVDESGSWNARYIPAYVRRYPFIFSETGPDQIAVCIDESCPDLNAEDGEALFDDAGDASPLLGQLVQFMRGYQHDLVKTREFVLRLEKLGLLNETNALLRLNSGEEFMVNGILMVEEEKLASLRDEDVLALFRSGDLALIHSHMISLSNLNRQVDMLFGRHHSMLQ